MKSTLPVFLMAFFCIPVIGQTLLHQETFESAPAFMLNSTDEGGTASGINPWVINNIYAGGPGSFMCLGFPIPFTVPAAPTQPAGIINNPTGMYLHIASQIAIDGGGTLPASSYVVADGLCIFGGQSTFTKMSSDVSTVGHDSVTLDFWWMCGGSTAYYGEVYYSIDGGSTWTIVNNPISGTTVWNGQTNWVSSEVTNSNWANQATLRFGFRFLSPAAGVGGELDPGFSIDDLVITGYDVVPSCTNTANTIDVSGCDSYVSPSGLYTWTSSNTYMDTIPNMAGCDSVLTVNVTINTVDASASQTGHTLSANNGGALYQWLDCSNAYAVVSGATSQNYLVTTNGSYAVSVNDNGCVDTSSCFTISDVGFENIDGQNQISVYPNPATNFVTVSTGNLISGQLVVTDVLGREIYRTNLVSNSTLIPLNSLSDGAYFITLLSEDGNAIVVEKLVKE